MFCFSWKLEVWWQTLTCVTPQKSSSINPLLTHPVRTVARIPIFTSQQHTRACSLAHIQTRTWEKTARAWEKEPAISPLSLPWRTTTTLPPTLLCPQAEEHSLCAAVLLPTVLFFQSNEVSTSVIWEIVLCCCGCWETMLIRYCLDYLCCSWKPLFFYYQTLHIPPLCTNIKLKERK